MKLFRLFLAVLCVSLLVTACNKSEKKEVTTDKAHVEQIVHDYLLEHPEILVQVSQKLQQMQMQEMAKAAVVTINKDHKPIFNNPQSLVIGNPKGKITLVEFFDYQCVHCAHMYPIVESLISSNDDLRVVLKEFPIFGEISQYAAAATLAAAEQGKGAEMHDALFKSGLIEGKLTKAAVLKLAKQVGLNVPRLEKDINKPAIQTELKNNFQLAQDLSIQGTPAFIVAPTTGGKDDQITFIPGGTDAASLQKAIDKAK